MSSKPQIGYITIRAFSHATEDPEKVQDAVRKTLPARIDTTAAFRKTDLTGHYGNPIILFEVKLTDKQAFPEVLEKIGNHLTPLDKETLNSGVQLHVDKSNLYLRFDKQHASTGKLRFGSNDPIHFKIHFKNKTADEIVTICREKGLLP